MECKVALKVRWTATEVTMLVEEWAALCTTPGSKTLTGERLSKAIFDRYNGRCIRTGQLRRSPAAVDTQRNRMVHFVRFVYDFDCRERAQGRRPWSELSSEEQLKVDIPLEWKRQVTTFTPEAFTVFKNVILPTEGQVGRVLKHKRRFTKSDKPRAQVRIERQPRWSSQDEVLLATQWGLFLRRESLTLAEFMEIDYSSRSCRRLVCPGRSSIASWRKLCALVVSWQFISAFNAQHQPGWFELDDDEQDSQIMWDEIPDNFEALEQEVFAAMEQAALNLKYDGLAKYEPKLTPEAVVPLSPKAISAPLRDGLVPSNLVSLALLCPTNIGTGTNVPATSDNALDRLLLEDDDSESEDEMQQALTALPTINDAACLVLSAKADESEQQPVDLEPAKVEICANANQTIVSALEKLNKEAQQGLRRLQTVLEQEAERTQNCIRALQLDRRAPGLVKHMELVVSQQNNRFMSALRNAEELCSQNGAEARSLMHELLGAGLERPRNGSTDLDGVVSVTAPSDALLY
ncbi:hypothetical protein PF010_g3155 [Phytophthora fragariae]|uniref:Uncharacterized protein n=1 Tax=Phytophthora fragariae TaxID=53985 RepID=A0A6G0PNI6_9STRA|nr:hypothetical protein PF010_g3155 [Phytophthora fragariae]KAE9250751.1 hypothetical protein PF004_g2806 [Phytophthora fragariae]